MYEHMMDLSTRSWRSLVSTTLALLVTLTWGGVSSAQDFSTVGLGSPKIIRKISQQSERLEMTTNSSRILTLDMSIPRVQVNNPELVAVTPLSATQIQISAKKPGVTQVNLWDSDKKIHTIDVIIYGDVRELEVALQTQFPNSSVEVRKYSQSLMLTGFVDSPDHVNPIMRLAEDYAPKVINNLQVGGVQQVLLKVKLYEVSRTKLRRLGVDFAHLSSGGGFIASRPSGLISAVTSAGGVTTVADTGGATLEFGLVSGNNTFFGFLDALEQNNIAKVLAEPNIVAISGRPAQFLEGGEIPILVPQGLGVSTIEYKPFGTEVDFLPIVLGNGNIRLEVRPRVSDIDNSIGVVLNGATIPGFRVRQADTAVEMKAGQTFALAGLIQRRTESIKRGLPFVSDIPFIGVPFRSVEERVNEIELLILVTPEFVDAMDPHEVPECFPGSGTMSPGSGALYCGGRLEVPNAYGPCGPEGCGSQGCSSQGCSEGDPRCGNNLSNVGEGYPSDNRPTDFYPGDAVPSNAVPSNVIPVGPGNFGPENIPQGPAFGEGMPQNENLVPTPADGSIHGTLRMPHGAQLQQSRAGSPYRQAAQSPILSPGYAAQQPAEYRRAAEQTAPPVGPPSVSPPSGRAGYAAEGGLIGPVGYEVE